MNNEIDYTELAGKIVEKFSAIFPSMSSWDQDKANKYRDAMADALRLNKDLGREEIQVGLKTILSGEYKGSFVPSINEFVSMCKSKLNNIRYLNRLPSPEKTAAEKEKSALVGKTSMEMIRGMLKDD